MAALQQEISCYGFKAKWELTDLQALGNHVTEKKPIDGMPDVKWNLKWNYKNDRRYELYLNIESECEISYTTFLYYFRRPGEVKTRFTGTSIGQKEIRLGRTTNFDFHSNATFGRLVISIDGYFSYTTKKQARILNNPSTVSEWVLLLKANFSKDFDIVIDENLIQIHKHFIAIESPVFAKMFESNFQETAENKVTITDAKHETVQAAMDYCYRQDISDFLQDLTNSINLLFFCDKYDFQTLKPMLEAYLSTKFLTKENISLLASTADQINSLQLRQACVDFVCDLLKKNQGFSAEELAKLDAKFKDDVLFQALN